MTIFPGPSVKKMIKMLGISKENAKLLKDLMRREIKSTVTAKNMGIKIEYERYVFKIILEIANKILKGFGVECVEPKQASDYRDQKSGISYVNTGDTYKFTLMYDEEKNKFIISSIGDQAESQPNRFA